MFERLRRGFFVGAALSFMLCLGFATPALADGETTYSNLGEVKLTAVIVAPVGTNASQDQYVFQFAGGGTVEAGKPETTGKIPVYSDGVEQDYTTIKDGDVVPTIPDVTLSGRQLTSDNSLTNEDLGQTVVQKSLSEILGGVTFPHAGIYTYEVTETSATSDPSKAYVVASQAKYRLRVWVKNTKTGNESVSGNTDLAIDYVTVQRLKNDDGVEEKNDDGSDKTVKVDPTNPATDEGGKINKTLATQQSGASQFVGDAESGRNVPGFTFANEYITIASLQVKKLYDGNHSDRTRYSTVELAVHSSTVMGSNANGSVLTYVIEGEGIDQTDKTQGNVSGAGERLKLDGVGDIAQANHYMVQFNNNGWCYIKADLKEGSSIRITGEFGPKDNQDKREILSTNGLFRGQTYYVLEGSPHDYRPTGYVYRGTDVVDPRVSSTGMDKTTISDSPYTIVNEKLTGSSMFNKELSAFALLVTGDTTGNDTTIFVVNSLDENKVAATGILVDNLPHILMIGVPLVVFAGMFVAKRRGNAA